MFRSTLSFYLIHSLKIDSRDSSDFSTISSLLHSLSLIYIKGALLDGISILYTKVHMVEMLWGMTMIVSLLENKMLCIQASKGSPIFIRIY